MDKEKIIEKIREYQTGETVVGITMSEDLIYENQYIKLRRIDSSNKWLGVPHQSKMTKQWGIIVSLKKVSLS